MEILESLVVNAESISFALLFVGLLVYVMRTNDVRERQYRDTIDRLTRALGTLEDIEDKINRMYDKTLQDTSPIQKAGE